MLLQTLEALGELGQGGPLPNSDRLLAGAQSAELDALRAAHARKLPDGHYVWIDACGEIGEVDEKGKLVAKAKISTGLAWGSIERLRNGGYPSDEDQEEARMLRIYSGKTGFIQLGWPCQGVVFLYEISTEWYDRYQRLVDYADDIGGFTIDESEEE